MKIGVIHGRFQMLHIGHMEYLMAGMKRCDYLIIGICNPDPEHTSFSAKNPHRSLLKANPLTYFERMEMIRNAFLDSKIERSKFEIIPFPIEYPENIKYYVPKDAVYFMTIYDEWGNEKKLRLEKMGYSVEVMWERSNKEKLTSGTEVRDKISRDEDWKQLVPKSTFDYILKNNIMERIKRLYENEK